MLEMTPSDAPAAPQSTYTEVAATAADDLRPEAGGNVRQVSRRLQRLSQAMVEHGDAFPHDERADPQDLEGRLRHFVWAQQAKEYLLLYRDVQLQLQIALLRQHEGHATEEQLRHFYERARQTLRDALEEWQHDYAEQRQALTENDKSRRRALGRWKHQHNPWPIFRDQLQKIATQSEKLVEEYDKLLRESNRFTHLRGLLVEGINASTTTMQRTRDRAQEMSDFIIRDGGSGDRAGSIAGRLEERPPRERLDGYTKAVNAATATLSERLRVTVGSRQGMLEYKDPNLRRATDQWIAANVMPLLYELWEKSDATVNNLDVASVNVRNRSLVLSREYRAGNDEAAAYEAHDLAQPFATFLDNNTERQRAHDELRKRLIDLIDHNLFLTAVYRAESGFLPLPLQSGINAFTHRNTRALNQFGRWLRRRTTGVGRMVGEATRQDRLSVSERTVRVVRQRQLDPNNLAYTNILVTKGYIGESFLVGRERETEHLRRLIEDWMLGYRGAVMITGRRLSGKTLFGEYITNRFFPDEALRLRPNTYLTVNGRRTNTTADLGAALAFVEKHTVQSQPMVWIDDLELWRDSNCTLAANVRALGRHIDDYSGRIFYMVSTTEANYQHLDAFLDIDRVFQSEVHLEGLTFENTERAILIRHGATHRAMVDAEGEILTETAFSRLVSRIHRATNGNIGDTVNRWAYFTKRYDDERVYQPDDRRFNLPAFLNAETAPLLATLYLEKQTQDYRLRRLFGPAYGRRYGNVLQRLLRIGLVIRGRDGVLEINESIVNDVGRMLEAENYLKPVD